MRLSTPAKVGLGLVLAVILLTLWLPFIDMEKEFSPRKNFKKNPERTKQGARNLALSDDSDSYRDQSYERRLPQVIGIGNKKCSTGALLMYLCAHPKLRCSKSEVHFFDNDDRYNQGVEYYKARLPLSKSDEITHEKSPKYFTAKIVPMRIKETYEAANQSVKFLLTLCDPAKRTYSDYKHFLLSDFAPAEKKRVYSSFDDYVNKELHLFEEFVTNTGLKKLETYNETDYLEILRGKWGRLLKGIYPYHLKRWYKIFPREDILIIDGDLLIQKPWLMMNQVQEFLNLPRLIQERDFVKNKDNGFYCLQKEKESSCLGRNKGRTRILTEDGTLSSTMSESTKKILTDFFHPYDIELSRVAKQNFGWIPSQNNTQNK